MANPTYWGSGGNDANSGATSPLRKLTLSGASGAVSVTSTNDTIINTAGTVTTTAANGVMASPRTLKGVDRDTCILTTAISNTNILYLNSGAAVAGDYIIKDLTLDGAELADYGFSFDVNNEAVNLRLENLKIIDCNFAASLLSNFEVGTLTIKNIVYENYLAEALSVLAGIDHVLLDGITGTPILWATTVIGNAGAGTISDLVGSYSLRNVDLTCTTEDLGNPVGFTLHTGGGCALVEVVNNSVTINNGTADLASFAMTSGRGKKDWLPTIATLAGNKCDISCLDAIGVTWGRTAFNYFDTVTITGNEIKNTYFASDPSTVAETTGSAYFTGGSERNPEGTYYSQQNNRYLVTGNISEGWWFGHKSSGGSTPSLIKSNVAKNPTASGAHISWGRGVVIEDYLVIHSSANNQRGYGLLSITYDGASMTTTQSGFVDCNVLVYDISKITGGLASVDTGNSGHFTGTTYYIPDTVNLASALLFRSSGAKNTAPDLTWAQWQASGFSIDESVEQLSYLELLAKETELTSATLARSAVVLANGFGGSSSSGGMIRSMIGSIL